MRRIYCMSHVGSLNLKAEKTRLEHASVRMFSPNINKRYLNTENDSPTTHKRYIISGTKIKGY